jgi:tetratricopeptide (TPR) repeat protein
MRGDAPEIRRTRYPMKTKNLLLMAALAAAGLTTVTGALLVPATVVAAETKEAKKDTPKIGAKMSKPLRAAQEAIQAKNWDAAAASLAEAAAIEPKTPYEAFMIDELGWYAKVQQKDYAGAVKSLKAAVDSGFVPEADLPQRYKALAQLSYELKDYPKAVEYGKKALELAPGSGDAAMIVAHSMYLSDDFAGARSFVDSQTASATTKPDEQLLLIGLRSNYELNDRAGTMRALVALIRHYPAQKYWTDLLNNQLYETKSDRDLRALYRLMNDTGTLSKPEEYSEMATTLMTGGFPSEAKQVLERGLAAGAFKGDMLARAQGELGRAKSAAEADVKELPGADAALAAAKSGNEMVAMGKLFFSVGDYAKAADAFAKGLAKGGVSDVDDANALLGIAFARTGKNAEAIEAFNRIRDPKLGEVAKLWKLHIETKSPPAPAPTPAPAG